MKMKKFINDPANLTDELLDGLVLANKEIIYRGDQNMIINKDPENADDRRGLVGCIPTYKIAGAAAAEGKSLEEVAAIVQRFADNMATLDVAVRGATHPSTGAALADLGEDDMEIGMGQHGEGGGGRQP